MSAATKMNQGGELSNHGKHAKVIVILFVLAVVMGARVAHLTNTTSAAFTAIAISNKAPSTSTSTSASDSVSVALVNDAPGQRFLPGTLPWPRTETIARCHVGKSPPPNQRNNNGGDKKEFDEYAERRQLNCLHAIVSPHTTTAAAAAPLQRSLTIRTQPKIGSSTLRKIMRETFGVPSNRTASCANLPPSNDYNNNTHQQKHHLYWTATREPLDRFISGYKEFVVTRAELYTDPSHRNKKLKYVPAYMRNFSEAFDPANMDKTRREDLIQNSSTAVNIKENTRLFELFLREYDGTPFDDHIVLQMSRLWQWQSGGAPARRQSFDLALDIKEFFPALTSLAHEWGLDLPEQSPGKRILLDANYTPGGDIGDALQVRASSVPDMIDVAQLSSTAIRKLCQLLARDYCCLNYELPNVCLNSKPQVMCEFLASNHDKNEEGRTSIRHLLV